MEKRAELQKELLSKLRLISFGDLIDHVGRTKFGHLEAQRAEAAQQLRNIIEAIFCKANYKDDVPAGIATDEKKNISKVREFIQDFSKKHKEAKPADGGANTQEGSPNHSPDDKSAATEKRQEIVDVWKDVAQQKKQLYKSHNMRTAATEQSMK